MGIGKGAKGNDCKDNNLGSRGLVGAIGGGWAGSVG